MSVLVMENRIDVRALVEAHHAEVWRFLCFLGCQPAQADDLTQETFLAVIRKGFEQRSPAASRAYLRTVARNLFLKGIRSARVRPRFENIDGIDESWQGFMGDGGSDDALHALRECLEALQPRARKAVDLRYSDSLTVAEVAGELDVPEATAHTVLHRARLSLRDCIKKRIES